MRGAIGSPPSWGVPASASSAPAWEFFHIRLGLEIEYHRTVREERRCPTRPAWPVGVLSARIPAADDASLTRRTMRRRRRVVRSSRMTDSAAFEAGSLRGRLSSLPLLSALDEPSLAALQAELEWLRLPGGAILFREDQIADALSVVVPGCPGVPVRGKEGNNWLLA